MTSQDPRKAIVFYHDNCSDGFGAAWAWHKCLHDSYTKVAYVAVKYGDNPFTFGIEFHLADVYILDFSFSRETLTAIGQFANKVTVIDHHKTAAEDLLNWEPPENIHVFFDMEYSGASLTHLILSPNTPPSPLISYIEDRDLWRHKLPYTHEVSAVVANTPKTFEAYTTLSMQLNNSIVGVADRGKDLLAQRRRICEEIVKDSRPCTIETDTGTYHGLACNCTPQFASDVGNILATDSGTFGATYYTTGKGDVKWSIRSKGDYDVSAIAKAYGGGGHKNAAGFTLGQDGTSCANPAIALWKINGAEGYEP
jgi:oligoribonuclease NrnB/cAMP/cGMP phosphodiesterase (DHH superfamily)